MDFTAPATARLRKAARARRKMADGWDVVGEFRLPDLRLSDVRLPEVRLPEVRLPEVRLPRIPDVAGARVRITDAASGIHARATLAVSLVREAVGR